MIRWHTQAEGRSGGAWSAWEISGIEIPGWGRLRSPQSPPARTGAVPGQRTEFPLALRIRLDTSRDDIVESLARRKVACVILAICLPAILLRLGRGCAIVGGEWPI